MTPAVDLSGAGMGEDVWAPMVHRPSCAVGDFSAARVVVVAPHPDDEFLAAGGLMRALVAEGAEVEIVAVTDGEASHPGRAAELRGRRARERADACDRLGIPGVRVHRLREPDSAVDAIAVAAALHDLTSSTDVLVAPWERDGHPDHDACGRAARSLRVAAVWSYFVWAWHWATSESLLGSGLRTFRLDAEAMEAKRAALQAFTSQLDGDPPILPAAVLARFTRPYEVFARQAP